MVRIYLDVETDRPNIREAFIREKIISAGILIDRTPYNQTSLKEIIEPIIFSSWSGYTEDEIVKKVVDIIRTSLQTNRFTVLVGFNLLRFDIPLLICKSLCNTIEEKAELSKMWYDCFSIDIMQQMLLLNNNRFKGCSVFNIVRVCRELGLNPPSYESRGSDISDMCKNKEYEKIEHHLIQDLNLARWFDLEGTQKLTKIYVEKGRPLFYQ
jgi:hypothetical protein